MSTRLITVTSARPDGATTVAVGLASLLAASSRTLLIDLNLDRPEIAPLLDLDERKTVYHLAYGAQLAPVTRTELEAHLVWHDGLAVLVGAAARVQRQVISEHFIRALVDAADEAFDHVVVDAGRVGPELTTALTSGMVLWTVVPGALGMAALDRAWREDSQAVLGWTGSVSIVLNRVDAQAYSGVEGFLAREYGLEVVGQIPDATSFWRSVELGHSLRALGVPVGDERGYQKRYGGEALATRRALEGIAGHRSFGQTAEEGIVGAAAG